MKTLWQWKYHENVEKGLTQPVETWNEFKRKLKRYFYPTNAAFQARDLDETEAHGLYSICHLIKFQDLALLVPEIDDRDNLYYLMANFVPWTNQQVSLKEPKVS